MNIGSENNNNLEWENHQQMYTMFAESSPTLHLRNTFQVGGRDPFPYSSQKMCSARLVFHANLGRVLSGWKLLLKKTDNPAVLSC